MTLTTSCKACDATFHGATEDDLVTAVQAHIASHDHGHQPTREQVLSVIRKRWEREAAG